jgi:hypothetical protein
LLNEFGADVHQAAANEESPLKRATLIVEATSYEVAALRLRNTILVHQQFEDVHS